MSREIRYRQALYSLCASSVQSEVQNQPIPDQFAIRLVASNFLGINCQRLQHTLEV
jgi:hypothetical protein